MRSATAVVPRYRDPVVRNVARLLLRSLQELHYAPTGTTVEMEARLGSISGHSRLFRLDVPLAVGSPALMTESARNLYQFNSGTMKEIAVAIQLTLLEAGIAARHQLLPQHAETQLFVHLDNGKRLQCSYEKISATLTTAGAAGSGGGSAGATDATIINDNPLLLQCKATVKSGLAKKTVARADLCCPGWCADVRFATAIEKKVPVELSDATEATATMWRLRSRARIPIGDFFFIDMSESRTCQDVWWYPPPSVVGAEVSRRRRHSVDAAGVAGAFGEGAVIPIPEIRAVDPVFSRKTDTLSSETVVEDIEVEVNLPAVLRAWKRVYGSAAVSTYLASSAPVETTVAGTTGFMGVTLKPAAVATAVHYELGDEVRDYAVVQSEREDPFLLRVAEEYMSVVQMLAAARVG